MADVHSNGTGGGDWGTAGTWAGGSVPTDGQSVAIDGADVVIFNVDQSLWVTGINGITIAAGATLKLSRTTSGYLFMKAATTIGGAGIFDCGASAADAIPFAVKHTITGGAGWYIKGNDVGGLTMTVFAAEPAIPTIKLSGAEAIGQTELGVDTNITGDIWADGDTINIDDIDKTKDSETRIIAAGGRDAAHIDITVALAAAKLQGAYVHLVTRNVKFIAVGATGYVLQNFTTAGKLTIAGGQWTSASYRLFYNCTGFVISGGVFYGNASAINTCTNYTISGGIFTGNITVDNTSTGITITGGTFTGFTYCLGASWSRLSGGLISGGYYGFYGAMSVVSGGVISYCLYALGAAGQGATGILVTGGTFTNCTYGIGNSSGIIKNATFSGNSTSDILNSTIFAFNTIFASTENSGYANLPQECYSESIDHDATAGKFAAWTKGGITTSASATPPTGYTTYMSSALADANNLAFWQKEVLVAPGASVEISMCLRKSGAMAYLPRCIVFNKASTDPFAGGAGLNTFTMTDSVDTWEYDNYVYTNTGANDVTLVIRFQGKNAAGTMLSAVTVNVINVDLTTALADLDTIEQIVNDNQALIIAR